MSDEQEARMEDLTDLLQDGTLSNPNDNALLNGESVKNGDMILTIRGFKKRQFESNGKVERAWIVFFEEIDAGCKLNKTREADLITIMGTNQFRDMIGRVVTLAYDPEIRMGGKKVGGIAIRRAEETLV